MNHQKTDVKNNEKSGGCCCANKDASPIETAHQNLKGKGLPMHTLAVEGAKCGGCVSKIESALKSVAGVEDARMDLPSATATVAGDVQVEVLISALEGVGFSAFIAQ